MLVSGAQDQTPTPAHRRAAAAPKARQLPKGCSKSHSCGARTAAKQAPPADGAPRAGAQPAEPADSVIYAPWTKFCLKGQERWRQAGLLYRKGWPDRVGQTVIAAVIIEGQKVSLKKLLRVRCRSACSWARH